MRESTEEVGLFLRGHPTLYPHLELQSPNVKITFPWSGVQEGQTSTDRCSYLKPQTLGGCRPLRALVANTDSGAAGAMAPHDVLTLKTCECHLIRERGLCRLN